MTKVFRERPEFLAGRAGEQRVALWLMNRGWYVIPSYDYSGEDGNKAPKLTGILDTRQHGYPVPDLDVCRKGNRQWVEVKTKTQASWTRKTQQLEHGMEYRLYDSYLSVQAETGTDCWLAIYETSTQELLVASLAHLGEPRKSTMFGSRMAYWPKRSFTLLHTFDGTEEA
jgi:hypothetical protein